MPTYDWDAIFQRDWNKLTFEQQQAFLRAVGVFVEDLRAGSGFRAGLRVKKIQGHEDIWELTWASNGRATFAYGEAVDPGDIHIMWRRIGTHSVFTAP